MPVFSLGEAMPDFILPAISGEIFLLNHRKKQIKDGTSLCFSGGPGVQPASKRLKTWKAIKHILPGKTFA
ncbi:hypothetical protein [Planococcus shenhongbingii]|uniref:hypothetical protein n=1 Tax=Planococcus shenhongbingii TaxID=3058398 RepID=UPI003462FCFC